jgi:hypothetical protein
VRIAYATLGLQTYFTSGPTETKAWTILKGMTAPQVSLFFFFLLVLLLFFFFFFFFLNLKAKPSLYVCTGGWSDPLRL